MKANEYKATILLPESNGIVSQYQIASFAKESLGGYPASVFVESAYAFFKGHIDNGYSVTVILLPDFDDQRDAENQRMFAQKMQDLMDDLMKASESRSAILSFSTGYQVYFGE